MEKINVKRCYVSMYNAEQNLVENFSIPKSRGAGDFSIQFALFAWNPETLVAEGFLDFNDQIWTTTIHNRLAELGARSIDIMTFQNNDNNHSAASAMNRVRSVAHSEGFKSVSQGTCNPKLAAKAEELRAEEKQTKTAEFDEKTQAAIKLSLEVAEEIKSNMATKDGLTHLEEITQTKSDEIKSSFVEMKDRINNDYQVTLANQAVTINKHEETIEALNQSIVANDRKMMGLETQIVSQRFIINKLNSEARQKEQQIAQLNATIEQKNQNILRMTNRGTCEEYRSILDQVKALLEENQACKKRKHDE